MTTDVDLKAAAAALLVIDVQRMISARAASWRLQTGTRWLAR